MVDINPTVSLIALNVNVLTISVIALNVNVLTPFKIQRQTSFLWILLRVIKSTISFNYMELAIRNVCIIHLHSEKYLSKTSFVIFGIELILMAIFR